MRVASLLLAVLMAVPVAVRAEPAEPVGPVIECLGRNAPDLDTIRALRFVSRDRVGSERVTVVKIYGRRGANDLRQLLVRFIEPGYMRGTLLLIRQTPSGSDMYLKESQTGDVKKVTAGGRSLALFGTDFTYEDFEHLELFDGPAESERLPDATIGGRPAYVLRTPAAQHSTYAYLETYVDQETCVVLEMRFYGVEDVLRKVLTVNPRQILKRGPRWVAHMAMMRDLRKDTTTLLLVDSTEQDVLLAEEMFSLERLRAASDSR